MKEGEERGGCDEVEEGEEGIDEADFLVGDYGQSGEGYEGGDREEEVDACAWHGCGIPEPDECEGEVGG